MQPLATMQHKPNPVATRKNSLNASSGDMSFNSPMGAIIAEYRRMGVAMPAKAGMALDFDPSEASSDPPTIEAVSAQSGNRIYRIASLHASANLRKPPVKIGVWFDSLNFFDNALDPKDISPEWFS